MNQPLVSLTIDGIAVQAEPGITILKAAQLAGIEIPTICYHDHCTANALCRICVVEVSGARTLVPACVATVQDGMTVYTHSERVQRSRRTILEMLYASVDLSEAPEIQTMAQVYGADPQRFPEAERRTLSPIDDNPMYIRDYAKCILCWRCVQVCAEDAQYTYAINFSGRGYETQISTFFHRPMPETTCVFCGQCVGVCPTGALKPKREWLLEQGYTPEAIMELTRSERRGKKRRANLAA
ncbi:2Fe-2S iron-sulfur cluster-binding protein [uncultured Thermanaerothrix sp.]|uniref:2Fe-2S iron-sulfur cluster-binding protein n=1 Tax=uncultured Thermanaerothrix sp. TaxID=1195149 RepID=UPI002616CFF9|nr:2Fe-2S iron-sulfur cluster-binding protein [uncultured Thermanaerothrix sp.]